MAWESMDAPVADKMSVPSTEMLCGVLNHESPSPPTSPVWASSTGAALAVTVTSVSAALFCWAWAAVARQRASAVAPATGVSLKWSAIEFPVSTAGECSNAK